MGIEGGVGGRFLWLALIDLNKNLNERSKTRVEIVE